MPEVKICELVGQTMSHVERDGWGLTFITVSGQRYRMYHDRDCCEQVSIEDICGELSDLVGTPILMAEERTNRNLPPKSADDWSWTWTFYTLATIKGYVTIRWYGESNGWYSEGVSIFRE